MDTFSKSKIWKLVKVWMITLNLIVGTDWIKLNVHVFYTDELTSIGKSDSYSSGYYSSVQKLSCKSGDNHLISIGLYWDNLNILN